MRLKFYTSFTTRIVIHALKISPMILSMSIAHAQSSQCQRIVTLSPAATELFWSLGFSKNLVGVSEHSDFPPEAKQKTNIGGYQKPRLEKILALAPTIVVTPNEGADQIQSQLEKLKLNTLPLTMRTLEEIPQQAQKIMKLCPQNPSLDQKSLDSLVEQWRTDIKAFNDMTPKGRFTFIVEVQAQPLMVAGPNTFLNQLFANCGGKNLISRNDYTILPLEKAYTLSPDLVFRVGMDSKEGVWPNHPSKKIRTLVLNPDIYARPSPRLIQKLRTLCKDLSL